MKTVRGRPSLYVRSTPWCLHKAHRYSTLLVDVLCIQPADGWERLDSACAVNISSTGHTAFVGTSDGNKTKIVRPIPRTQVLIIFQHYHVTHVASCRHTQCWKQDQKYKTKTKTKIKGCKTRTKSKASLRPVLLWPWSQTPRLVGTITSGQTRENLSWTNNDNKQTVHKIPWQANRHKPE